MPVLTAGHDGGGGLVLVKRLLHQTMVQDWAMIQGWPVMQRRASCPHAEGMRLGGRLSRRWHLGRHRLLRGGAEAAIARHVGDHTRLGGPPVVADFG